MTKPETPTLSEIVAQSREAIRDRFAALEARLAEVERVVAMLREWRLEEMQKFIDDLHKGGFSSPAQTEERCGSCGHVSAHYLNGDMCSTRGCYCRSQPAAPAQEKCPKCGFEFADVNIFRVHVCHPAPPDSAGYTPTGTSRSKLNGIESGWCDPPPPPESPKPRRWVLHLRYGGQGMEQTSVTGPSGKPNGDEDVPVLAEADVRAAIDKCEVKEWVTFNELRRLLGLRGEEKP